jgi:REP element-mobilizing transposase RayT
MKDYQSLSHTKWDCKYHVEFISKKSKKLIFRAIRKQLGEVLHELAGQNECRILEGHLMSDHIHMYIRSGDLCLFRVRIATKHIPKTLYGSHVINAGSGYFPRVGAA